MSPAPATVRVVVAPVSEVARRWGTSVAGARPRLLTSPVRKIRPP